MFRVFLGHQMTKSGRIPCCWGVFYPGTGRYLTTFRVDSWGRLTTQIWRADKPGKRSLLAGQDPHCLTVQADRILKDVNPRDS